MGKKKAAKKATIKAGAKTERESKKVATKWPRKKGATPRTGTRRSGKNIVLCLDGTGNHFKEHNSNVVKLFHCLERGTARWMAFYDAGVGTLAAPDFRAPVGKKVDKMLGLAFGIGVRQNLAEAYSYLMDQDQPGDRIYTFEFSRGAYTAHALAGLIHSCGLLQPGLENLIPYALKLFSAAKHLDFKVIAKFKSTYSRGDEIDIHLLGLWDTVSAYGWIYNPVTLPFTTNNTSVQAVRHALALDERRLFFKPRHWGTGAIDCKQVWFAGVHSDVGGGYPETESGQAKIALEWMITEAEKFGLKTDQKAYKRYVLGKGNSEYIEPGAGMIHQSLKRAWWIAELLPQRVWDSELGRRRLQLWPRPSSPRKIKDGATLHRSVLERIGAGDYRPASLKPSKN